MRLLLLLIMLCSAFLADAQEKYTVYFETGKDILSNEHIIALENWLQANQNIEILKVYGYTESIRNESDNLKLSDRRIKFVTDIIKKYNRFSSNPDIRAFGEAVSGAGNNPEDRKVEIWYNNLQALDNSLTTLTTAPKTELFKRIENSKVGDVLEIKNLIFKESSNIILQESKESLEDLLQIMKNMTTLKIDIQGHICCQRHDTHKIALSRAKAVYDYLINNGIDKARVTYQSFGGSRPIFSMPELTEAQQIANRRVEIQIVGF
jgi:outer membrane protein OmpA-like peptidoglycan-associated protein